MEVSELKSYLKLKIIWKDDDMFELEINASNNLYFGTTEVYDTSESLYEFAQTLVDFPKNEKQLIYELGNQDGYAFFSMRFYCIDGFGHIGVEIILEENKSTDYRKEAKSTSKFEIIVEPSAIDNFQKSLSTISKKQEGIAILYGRDNRL